MDTAPTPWCLRDSHGADGLLLGGMDMTGDDWAELRTRCEQRVDGTLRQTGLPQPWDINEFLDRVEQLRGREIDLCAVAWTAGTSTGAWRRHADHDVIAYSVNTSGHHQDHIILHELGHVLAEHAGRCVLSEAEARRLGPGLLPAAFSHLLERAHLGFEEHEAELFAHLVLARASASRQRNPRRYLSPTDQATAATADELTRAFG